jgi:murein DD-endopeptidase MepM/ murein hydrolase activator NlpD
MGSNTGRRTRGVALVLGLLLAVPMLTTGVVAAGPVGSAGAVVADSVNEQKKSIDQQIAEVRASLEGANADFVEAAVALKKAEAGLVTARADLATAREQLAAAAALDRTLAEQLVFARAEEAKAVKDLESRSEAEQGTRRALGEIARQTYVGSDVGGLSVLLQAESPEQLTERLAYAGAALRARNGAIDRLAVQQAEIRANSTRLAAVRAKVAELKRRSAAVVVEKQGAEKAAAAAEAQISTLVVEQQQAVATVQGKIAAEKKRLDQLGAEQARLQAILAERARQAAAEARRKRQAGSGAAAPGPSGGVLSRPSGAPISSGFGMRYHPILHIYRMHTGTDFAAPCGSPVYAAASGRIISAGWAGGYGNRIIIDHGYVKGVGLATTYNHLTRFVRSGGSVSRGQLIAYSGTTGLSTGCHLHFEVLANGRFVNPMGWL